MCLCEGKGSVPVENGGVIQWHNCPNSNCTYDKGLAELKWQQFKKELREWEQQEKCDAVVS